MGQNPRYKLTNYSQLKDIKVGQFGIHVKLVRKSPKRMGMQPYIFWINKYQPFYFFKRKHPAHKLFDYIDQLLSA